MDELGQFVYGGREGQRCEDGLKLKRDKNVYSGLGKMQSCQEVGGAG